MSLDTMSSNINAYKLGYQKIYNLSNQGGFIYGTIPLSINNSDLKDFKSLNKEILKKELKYFLTDFSKKQLSTQDKDLLDKELIYVKELVEYIESLKLSSSETFEEFDLRIQNLVNKFFFPSIYCSFLITVFIHFFNIILQYVYYCLNSENIAQKEFKIEKVEKFFLDDLIKLLRKYISYIENIKN